MPPLPAYRQGPYELFVELPVPPRPEIHSARGIDPQTGRYTFDATTGGFRSMHSTTQRVLLLCAFAEIKSKFITPQDLEQRRRSIILALEPLTRQPDPAIELQSVMVESSSPGMVRHRIRFKDLTTDQDQTVQV